jgi:phosphoglycerol transferase MdoB-like AlkP superfamily enzyme
MNQHHHSRSKIVALLHGLLLGAAVGAALAIWLSLARVLMLAYYWPSPGTDLWPELSAALIMGLRFDLKMGAVTAFLLFPFLGWKWRGAHVLVQFWALIYAVLTVVNFYYFGFYKLPIDSVIFGLFDDDTHAVLQTIWHDFPLLQIAMVLSLAIWTANKVATRTYANVWQWTRSHWNQKRHGWFFPVILLSVIMVAKGTWYGMALQLDNTIATSKPFLNHMVQNGVVAMFHAWDAYRTTTDLGSEDLGLKAYGFSSLQEAVHALAIDGETPQAVRDKLRAQGVNHPTGKNMVFFQMESWSAEPFRYQSKEVDVLGRLANKLDSAWLFDNFDAAQNGTHPALEAILFGTPVTPISNGQYRNIKLDWSVVATFKKAGYDTVFITSGKSGWRELNRVLPVQGFDEVIDEPVLLTQYPEAQGGLWGVFDEYMMRAIKARLDKQPKDRPLFIYAMSTTNHPPYELPSTYVRFPFAVEKWPGDKGSEHLLPNLQTYRYANDELANFLDALQTEPWGKNTVVAATGDHNVRTFGQYATPESRVLLHQVPFVVWGGGTLRCPATLHHAASHLDMFPTLFPLLGIHDGYLLTGRNLVDCTHPEKDALAVTFTNQVRSDHAIWTIGQPSTQACQPVGSACRWNAREDEMARARVGLLDWNVRHRILKATGKNN